MDKQLKQKLEKWHDSPEYKYKSDLEKSLQPELNKFRKRFTMEYINAMHIDNYVEGKLNRKTFCYYVENTFQDLGRLSRKLTAYHKFVIYWDKDIDDYSFGDKRTKQRRGFGDNISDIYDNVKNELIKVIEASKKNDYSAIKKSPLNVQFKNKIAYLYNPTKQMPVYSNDDLTIILTMLEIPFKCTDSCETKRKKLFDYYKTLDFDFRMTPCLFINFIYSWFGFLEELRGEEVEKPLVIDPESYNLIEILNPIIYKPKKSSTRKGAKNHHPGSDDDKVATGRFAENIVHEFLKLNQYKMHISNIRMWCQGKNKDDSKGYDFSFINSKGKTCYIEVKGTKLNMRDRISFEMSSNEYNVMAANRNNYYVYFINDVYHNHTIKSIRGNRLKGEMPTKYRFTFN